ncbi:MAG: hypothetical protein J0L91_01240 [Burkholderiales bacterium]|nr:hypothetical protein [Burkholderiales bacterium]
MVYALIAFGRRLLHAELAARVLGIQARRSNPELPQRVIGRRMSWSVVPWLLMFCACTAAGAKASEPIVRAATPEGGAPEVRMGGTISVHLSDLEAWGRENDVGAIVLYLSGSPASTNPRYGANSGELIFDLTWRSQAGADGKVSPQLGRIFGRPQFALRAVSVHLGVPGRVPFDASGPSPKVLLRTIDGKRFTIFVVIELVLLYGFWSLSRKSHLLRDSGATGMSDRPYSLARTQMAVWFIVVVGAFLFIWVVTGTVLAPTGPVLALIGVSAGTALSATFIDAGKAAGVRAAEKKLDTERLALETELRAAAALAAATPDSNATSAQPAPGVLAQAASRVADRARSAERLAQVQAELEAVGRGAQPPQTQGFWKDILSDENGVAFHRFQIVVWTAVLVLVFAFEVYDGLSMPEFPWELLALMGISSGTYLGFKIPESQ